VATLRTFVAIELGSELRAHLRGLQDSLRAGIPPGSVRWVRPEGIHLTLKFLGDTPVSKLGDIGSAISLAAGAVAPFICHVGGLGCFPNARNPRVVWVGLQEPTGALVRLKGSLETHVAPLGFPTEKRRFHPHLTLGRVHRRASRNDAGRVGEVVAATAPEAIGKVSAATVSLIQSELLPSGAVYTTLAEVSLAEGVPPNGLDLKSSPSRGKGG
jgi:2'-5' RNA ligase